MVRANEQLIENILRGGFVPLDTGFHGWIVVLDNRIFTTRAGKFIFPSREKAVKAFHDRMVWTVARHYSFFRERGISVPNPPWTGDYWSQKGEYWRDFKNCLGDRLKFVQI